MTPLEFLISVKNSQATSGLEEVRQQIASFKNDVNSAIEGPARESRVREEIRGMIKDISLGKDPIYVMISSLERLTEVFRLAVPAAAALAIGFGLQSQLRAAATSATEFFDLFQEGMAVNVQGASENALKELVKKMDALEEKYRNRGFFEKLIFGSYETSMAATASRVEQEAKDRIDQLEADRIDAHTEALRSMSDDELATEGQIAQVREDLEQKAQQAREAGQERAAEAYEEQMGPAIDRIKQKEIKADEERLAKRQELVERIAQTNEDAWEEEMSPERKRDHLLAKRSQLLDWISRDTSASPLVDKDDRRLKAELQVAELTKQINEQTRQIDKDAADAKTKAANETKQAAEKAKSETDRLNQQRRETLRAQFEALDKEEKQIVARQALAQLEARLRGTTGEKDRLGLEKSTADLTRLLAESGGRNLLMGVNAEEALRGNMSSGTFSRATNDAANRAAAQRDQANKWLQQIASRIGSGSIPDAF